MRPVPAIVYLKNMFDQNYVDQLFAHDVDVNGNYLWQKKYKLKEIESYYAITAVGGRSH